VVVAALLLVACNSGNDDDEGHAGGLSDAEHREVIAALRAEESCLVPGPDPHVNLNGASIHLTTAQAINHPLITPDMRPVSVELRNGASYSVLLEGEFEGTVSLGNDKARAIFDKVHTPPGFECALHTPRRSPGHDGTATQGAGGDGHQ
jgi:hypothetical protein